MKSPRYSIQNKILERLSKGDFRGSTQKLAYLLKIDRNSAGYAIRRLEELGEVERVIKNKHAILIRLRT